MILPFACISSLYRSGGWLRPPANQLIVPSADWCSLMWLAARGGGRGLFVGDVTWSCPGRVAV